MFYAFRLRAGAALLAALLAAPVLAQSPGAVITADPAARSRALREVEQASFGQRSQKAKSQAEAAELAQRDLNQRLADFAHAWNKLILLAEKGVWNTKQAAKTRKAFEKLVHSDGWIEENK